MENTQIDVLVTFDRNYIPPFRTMLKSLVINNPGEQFHIWLLHSRIPAEDLRNLEKYCHENHVEFSSIQVEHSMFQNAPITDRYPQEMYYRLMAPHLLPISLNKVLYLDPDILVMNPVRPLWTLEMGEHTFVAASHSGITDITNSVNRIRLGTNHDYYNSGVMLIDLGKARTIVKGEDIFQCVREHEMMLVLPDQDVFNYLYGTQTLQVDDAIWNYDARNYYSYLIREAGACNLEWVAKHTVFLHFCGTNKPWLSDSTGRFDMLYKHYMQIASR